MSHARLEVYLCLTAVWLFPKTFRETIACSRTALELRDTPAKHRQNNGFTRRNKSMAARTERRR